MNIRTETDSHVGGKDFLDSFQLPFICDNNSIPFVHFQLSEGINLFTFGAIVDVPNQTTIR